MFQVFRILIFKKIFVALIYSLFSFFNKVDIYP